MSEEGDDAQPVEPPPTHFARVIPYKRTRAITLVADYRDGGLSDDVRKEASKLLIGGFEGSDVREDGVLPLSVYATPSRAPDTAAHALGVVAFVLGNGSNFGAPPRENIPGKPLTTLFIEIKPLQSRFKATHTPDQCTTFYPASEHHWDLEYRPDDEQESEALIVYLIQCLEDVANTVEVAFDPKTVATGAVDFGALARCVVAHCCARYGLTETSYDAQRWRDAASLSAAEQVTRLRVIAAQRGYTWAAAS